MDDFVSISKSVVLHYHMIVMVGICEISGYNRIIIESELITSVDLLLLEEYDEQI